MTEEKNYNKSLIRPFIIDLYTLTAFLPPCKLWMLTKEEKFKIVKEWTRRRNIRFYHTEPEIISYWWIYLNRYKDYPCVNLECKFTFKSAFFSNKHFLGSDLDCDDGKYQDIKNMDKKLQEEVIKEIIRKKTFKIEHTEPESGTQNILECPKNWIYYQNLNSNSMYPGDIIQIATKARTQLGLFHDNPNSNMFLFKGFEDNKPILILLDTLKYSNSNVPRFTIDITQYPVSNYFEGVIKATFDCWLDFKTGLPVEEKNSEVQTLSYGIIKKYTFGKVTIYSKNLLSFIKDGEFVSEGSHLEYYPTELIKLYILDYNWKNIKEPDNTDKIEKIFPQEGMVLYHTSYNIID